MCSGRAVSSLALCRSQDGQDEKWSSATIRSELAVLEKLGYLHQPHASAGRFPSARGLKNYIDVLRPADAPPPELKRAVDQSLAEVAARSSSDTGMRATVCVLSELLGCVAVSFVARARPGVVARVDLVPLVGSRSLVVATLEDGTTTVQPVGLEDAELESIDANAISQLEARLRMLCIGRTLTQARVELVQLVSEQRAKLDALLVVAVRVGLRLCSAAALDPIQVEVAGHPMFARHPAVDGISDVLELLADYRRLAEILCQLVPEPEPGASCSAKVCIGEDLRPGLARVGERLDKVPSFTGLTLVGCRLPEQGGQNPAHRQDPTGTVHPHHDDAGRYGVVDGLAHVKKRHGPTVESGRKAVLALLGSDRMDYESVIPLVEYAARALASRTSA